jgi:hypothetical protein
MSRLPTVAIVLACLVIGIVGLPASAQPPRKEKRQEKPADLAKDQDLDLRRSLEMTINVRGLEEPVKLKLALEFIIDQYPKGKMLILVDKQAFVPILGNRGDVTEQMVALPEVGGYMSVKLALRLLLSQVANGGATYMIRDGHVEIVPTEDAITVPAGVYLSMPIDLTFQKSQVRQAIEELAHLTNFAIVIDERVGDKAVTPITANFRGAPLEDVLVAITESAGLKFVVMNKSVLVTLPEHARAIQEEENIRQEKRRARLKARPK